MISLLTLVLLKFCTTVEKKTTSTSCGTNTNNNDGPLRIITPTPKNKLEAEKNPGKIRGLLS